MATQATPVSARSFWRAFLDDLPDFRARMFVTATACGFFVAMLGVVANGLNNGGLVQILLSAAMAFVALAMIWYAKITGRYEQARVASVVIVFLLIFPWMFFTGGGYQGGMPALLVFGMGFTGLAVVGARMLWSLLGLEFVVYTGCCLTGYFRPDLVTLLAGRGEVVVDVILCVTIAGVALSTMLYLMLQMHEGNANLLVAKNTELEEIDRGKSELLAMVAHELNTPLAVMRVHLDEAGSLAPESMQHTIRVMTAENERLTRLVGQLRDVSRINSGRIALDLNVEDLSAIIQEVLRTYQPLAARNGNVLALARGGAYPQVLVDQERVAQVLVNLLSNAGRHTTNGTITVAVREAGQFAEVSVKDTGEGIPLNVQDHLFERVGRPSPAGIRSSRDTGLGLGLIISRHIMQEHGGDLEIESVPGEGTTATLTFPLAKRS